MQKPGGPAELGRWWASIESLSPRERWWAALAVAGATVVLAFLVALATRRWRNRPPSSINDGPVAERAQRFRRGLVMLILFLGAYTAIELAPLPSSLERFASGTVYVLGAITTAWLVVSLGTLVLASYVLRVPTEERARLEREYIPLGSKVLSLAVGLMAAVVIAKHFGHDLSSLIAALGVGSLAVGLAAQQTFGNMISGFVLLVDRPFRPGDRVKLATAEEGEVVDIGVRSTRIRMADGNLLIVPNTELANSRVIRKV
jgi:small-conductance mechanosensitive channel